MFISLVVSPESEAEYLAKKKDESHTHNPIDFQDYKNDKVLFPLC